MCSARRRTRPAVGWCIGIVRARAKIGLLNFVYNIRRLVTLERMPVA